MSAPLSGAREVINLADFKVGTVSHYYDKISVAVLDLSASLRIGDLIRFSGSTEFSQKVESLQVEHEQVTSAAKGDTVGLKVTQPVKPGDEVVKTS